MDDIAIQITGLKKRYRLGTIGGGTLQGDIQSWWARIRKKEDPNLKIGQKQGNKNEVFMALDGIDLTVRKGERLGIIGHNGAGKSTLLKLLSRVTGPTEGTICIDGRISSMLEVGTGFNPELTGRENIYLNGAILGMSKAEVDSKIDEIIEFSECAKFIDTPVKRYSSGMYVKLAFAVAAHLDSEILVMDEVLAVGDMKFQQKCLGKMSDVSESEGRTVLYVSHNMNTIRQLCDRCIVLDHGKIIFNGDVEDAINIYSGISTVSQNKIDFSTFTHAPMCIDGAKMLEIELLDKEEWKAPAGSKFKFNLKIRVEKPIENVNFRVWIQSGDDTSITVIKAKNMLTDVSPDIYSIPLEMDISQMTPGTYHMTASLYRINEYGTFEFYDRVSNAVEFELEPFNGYNDNMGWSHKEWGYVNLPDFIINGGKNQK